MLVDGGPDQVFQKVLKPRLMALPHAAGGVPTVDVLCLTHVDEDHVVGVMRLLKELARANRDQLTLSIDVRRVWFNSVDELIDGVDPGLTKAAQALVNAAPKDSVVPASYGQGGEVRTSVAALGRAGNPPFGGSLLEGSAKKLHEMDVTVVSPSKKALDKLAKKWRAAVKAKSAKAIGASYVDRSVPNLSSIALHISYSGRTALLTGDARGDHLLAGLEATGLLAPNGSMSVDVFKLPHHGSKNNAEPSLFNRIRADHYVISADGIKHEHPSTETLEWLVASRGKKDSYTIHLTHQIPKAQATLEKLRDGCCFAVKVGEPYVEIALADV